MTSSKARQASGWLLLAIFAFQMTAGALHRLELHCESHQVHLPDRPSSEAVASHKKHECAGHAHDPAHCTICQHILNSTSALVYFIPGVAGLEVFSAASVPSPTSFSVSPVDEQRTRAPPSPPFSS
jgi:hypothetical protein